jgi:hypothetical protein
LQLQLAGSSSSDGTSLAPKALTHLSLGQRPRIQGVPKNGQR